MANVLIEIASEFTGNKAFKQADTATDKLSKNVKKLAGAFGLAFGTTQVLAYGKAAVRAAAADQKAQQQLALALKNVGLERDAASSEAYIQRLQSEFGIVDDLLRPAYQTLAVATRDTAESQRLFNLALDISAATGKDVGAVTTALSRAYLGNNAALTRLGVGISKADLKTKSFYEVTQDLTETFKGSATAAANTFAGSMAKLEVASANVQEILGKGIIDSLQVLSGNTSVEELAVDMETAATNAAAFLVTLSKIVKTINAPLMAVSGSLAAFIEKTSPFVNLIIEGDPSGFMGKKPKPFTTPMTISGQVQVKQQTAITKLTKEQAKNQAKILKDKRLQNAIDKANLALNKGSEVFDMDKIQIAAALTNQAEQLGKATSASQVMQIANDTARLNVKRSILALEDAIAAKDEQAIIAATAKLNADLKALAALTGQNVQLASIKSVLETLKPKDLIDQNNLDEALRKIAEMLAMLGMFGKVGSRQTPANPYDGAGSKFSDFVAPISTAGGSIGAILEYAEAAAGRANAFADLLDMQNAGSAVSSMGSVMDLESIARSSLLQGLAGGAGVAGAVSGSRYAAQGANAYNITINAGVGSDPNAIAEYLDDVLRQARDRGTLTIL